MDRSRWTLMFLVLAVAVVLAAPGVAMATGAATVFPADAWEPDDTTATAQVLPYESEHTFDARGGFFAPAASLITDSIAQDIDTYTITAEETDTVFLAETFLEAGLGMRTSFTVWDVTPTGTLLPLYTNTSSLIWSPSLASTLYWSAPHPGTFFVTVSGFAMLGPAPAAAPGDVGATATMPNGAYRLFQSKGIARRVSGSNRYATAAAVSRTMVPDAAIPLAPHVVSTVLVANGANYPDALAGATLAGVNRAPMLLTGTTALSPDTKAEIERLSEALYFTGMPFRVYVLGSASAVPTSVVEEIETIRGVTAVVRIGGATRFETASLIAMRAYFDGGGILAPSETGARDVHTQPPALADTALIVSGYAWPDALVAGPMGAGGRAPILLTRPDSLPAETSQTLVDLGVTKAVVVGGPSVVASSVLDELRTCLASDTAVTRVSGANRYETAEAFAAWCMDNHLLNPACANLVSGENFPDGLAAAPMSAYSGAPLLLTRGSALSPEADEYMDTYWIPGPYPSYVIGGSSAVSEAAMSSFSDRKGAVLVP